MSAPASATPPTSNDANQDKPRAGSKPQAKPKARQRKQAPPVTPAPSYFESTLAKFKKQCTSKSAEQLEQQLQSLLLQGALEDAAYLIAASEALGEKYHISDTVRLMIEQQHFDTAARVIRDMKLQETTPEIVTMLISALVTRVQFQTAIRVAQEMVPAFRDTESNAQEKAVWTPMAMVQAMVRAKQFRLALKYSRQFKLEDHFPAPSLVSKLFENRSWEDAVSAVLEYKLYDEYPLDGLTSTMLANKQWGLAVKVMGRLSREDQGKWKEQLVRQAAASGDFISCIKYLREFKLDDPATFSELLKYLVDEMLRHDELYKAIKYAHKFELATYFQENGQSSYDVKILIRLAMQRNQLHVASTYIKKLKLQDAFTAELAWMKRQQEAQVAQFRQFFAYRQNQFAHPAFQQELQRLLASQLQEETYVEQEGKQVEKVISLKEEIVPKRSERQQVDKSNEVSPGNASTEQSRFNFARPQERTPAPPPGLAPTPPSPAASPPLPQSPAVSPPMASPPGFNFQQYPSNVNMQNVSPMHRPPMPPMTPQYSPSYPAGSQMRGPSPSVPRGSPQAPGGTDVAALAMQFHSLGSMPSSNSSPGQTSGYYNASASSPSRFKPSVGYTTVTTTRQPK